MIDDTLERVLDATGYTTRGQPVSGVSISEEAIRGYRGEAFRPDAVWQGASDLSVYFKSEDTTPDQETVAAWRREIWNTGSTPLLWVVSPETIDLYNGFGKPLDENDASRNLIQKFEHIDSSLRDLDALAGRISMETGQFWEKAPQVNRKHSVDQRLLSDLSSLESNLKHLSMPQSDAQELIGRSIFVKYLVDRDIITSHRLSLICGETDLAQLLKDTAKTKRLFRWLRDTINGDVFPDEEDKTILQSAYLSEISRFLQGIDPASGQASFFPYQFNIIPVELISAIYEQFAHTSSDKTETRRSAAKETGIYYTPLSLVSLILDEVMSDITGEETVLDLTCGSGVFLVESLRRLVNFKSTGSRPTREMIRATLGDQIYGVDISKTAVHVATLSLYLCALDLDPNPYSLSGLKFKPIVGSNILVGDARAKETKDRLQMELMENTGTDRFDLVVGNPPWTFKGKEGTAARALTNTIRMPRQPRGEALDFVFHAFDVTHSKSRFGIVLSATPFFSRSRTGQKAVSKVIEPLLPVTLVNLSNLSSWLFDNANMPALILLGRHGGNRAKQLTTVQIPWFSYGSKSRSFEISPSDVTELPLSDWKRNRDLLKTAFVGQRRDMYLVDRLISSFDTIAEQLHSMGTEFRVGLTYGDRSNDAGYLRDLPLLAKDDLKSFSIPASLPRFGESRAERPRDRSVYRAPLILVKEFLLKDEPRLVVGVSERDLVFTKAYYGASFASFSSCSGSTARILAGILSSSLASWYLLMTASAFGLWMRNLLLTDLTRIPVPDLQDCAESSSGRQLLEVCSRIQDSAPTEMDWRELDAAVLSLYGLDRSDRIVVEDGLQRAGYQWDTGRLDSMIPANHSHLTAYAQAFLETVGSWLSTRNRQTMRAEILDLPTWSPLRIVSFVLQDRDLESTITTVDPHGTLNEVVTRIGLRLHVRLSNFVTGRRELRVHGEREVIIIKPSARRHWLRVSALEDADTVISESIAEPRM